MRHAHASHALDRSVSIYLVQVTLGHASVSTTGRYLDGPVQPTAPVFIYPINWSSARVVMPEKADLGRM